MTALHPAQLWAARQRMAAIGTAIAADDPELLGVAIDGMDHSDAVYTLVYVLGAFMAIWDEYGADGDDETWTEYLRSEALPRRD
jgi:hypothetical protein